MSARFFCFFLLLIVMAAPAATAQTQAVCPSLSTGSAVTAFGGDPTVTAHSENNWQGECHFTRQAARTTQAIDIRVSKVDLHPCPQGSTRLKALGNEAVQCPHSTLRDVHTIAGRVRDAWFQVTITNVPEATDEPPGITHPADQYGASLLERLAEQVVGNLY